MQAITQYLTQYNTSWCITIFAAILCSSLAIILVIQFNKVYTEEFKRFLAGTTILSLFIIHIITTIPDWIHNGNGYTPWLLSALLGLLMLTTITGHCKTITKIQRDFYTIVKEIEYMNVHDPVWKLRISSMDIKKLNTTLQILHDSNLKNVLTAYKVSGWSLVITGMLLLIAG